MNLKRDVPGGWSGHSWLYWKLRQMPSMNHTFPEKKNTPDECLKVKLLSKNSDLWLTLCNLSPDLWQGWWHPYPSSQQSQADPSRRAQLFVLPWITDIFTVVSKWIISICATSPCQFPNNKSHILYTESHTKFDIFLSLPLVQRGWAIFRWHMSW